MIQASKKYAHPGFTFIELVVVILILGLLVGVGVPVYMRFTETAKENTTKANLKLLKSSIDLYHMENNRYPARLNDLAERPKGEAGKGWKAYIQKLPVDGWQREFYYKVLPAGGKRPYDLYSYGSNGPESNAPEERISAWD